MNTGVRQSTRKKLTVKIELHRVNPYKIWWIGEKTFTHRGQEETFVRFTIDPKGNQVGDFTYVEKDFVMPFKNTVGSAPNNFEGDHDEPSGAVELNNPQIRNSQAGR